MSNSKIIKIKKRLLTTILDDSESKTDEIKKLRGSLSKYANKELQAKEKEAWKIAVEEKYKV